MQSWGTRSRFSNRDTGLEPSRSGVIGLLCAALGRPRDEPLDDFLPLKMAVRVDREGRLMRDYHTAQDVRRADPSKGTQDTVLSERYYLADADFLVGLEGNRELLERLDTALRQPVWTLFLGRKSFVPALPVSEGIVEIELLAALRQRPWRGRDQEKSPKNLRYVIQVDDRREGEPRQDVPLSFVSRDRRFAIRYVKTESYPLPQPNPESPRVPQQTIAEPPQSQGPV
jgi:CRISPR system Cascade subunit CasD